MSAPRIPHPAAVLAALLAACAPADRSPSGDGRPLVVTTVTMLTDAAREVGGADVVVQGLMAAGVDPHLFRAGRSEVATLHRADLVVALGLHLEAQLLEALERLDAPERPVRYAGTWLDQGRLRPTASFGGAFDPHVWMDPLLWSDVVRGLGAELARLDPDAALDFHSRAERHAEQLTELDGRIRAAIQSVPEEARVLVTAHDAFGYFGERYGLEVHGLLGLSTESEAGLRRVEELVDLLVERRVPAVFAESTVSESGVRALIEGARARGHEVRLGGRLFSDATGPAHDPAGSVVGMLEHNVSTIVAALGGRPESLIESASAARSEP